MCVCDKNKESGSTGHIYVTQKRTKSTEPYHICVQQFLRTIPSTDVLKYHLIGLHLSSSLPSHPRLSLRWLVFRLVVPRGVRVPEDTVAGPSATLRLCDAAECVSDS